jgi:hypothetical protein
LYKKDKKGKYLKNKEGKLMKVITEKNYNTRHNFPLDCDKHIVDKAETCLVENGSLRGRFARFNRRTKSYSKSFKGLEIAVYLWLNRDRLIENRLRYSSYCGKYPYSNGVENVAEATLLSKNKKAI